MSTNEGTRTSRHYREHTRQQDGWTVLASPPGANVGVDLPPPYTPEAAPAPAAAAPAAGPTGTALSFEIPTNTNVIGATRVTRTKKYTRGVPFNVAFVEICGIMGLDPSTAHIGYNWDNDKISAPVHELVTAADWADCLQSGIGQTERARVRMVSCIIKNLNLPEETAVVAKPSKKRKERASSVERKTYDFTKEYKELRSQLSCAKHRDQLCYVHPDGHHVRVEPAHVSLWAKEISFGKVTKLRPPENIMFQDYFLPERKRARTSKPESPKNPCAPTIHVTVNTGSSGAVSPLARSPLAPITAATANAANMKHPPVASQSHTRPDHSDFENIYYPPVTDILQSIDDSKLFEDSVALPFPAVVFADDLHSFQITRVDQVTLLEPQFFVDQVNMPRELAEHFVDESITAMERTAAKGKGRALF